jgi:hypothetical protein
MPVAELSTLTTSSIALSTLGLIRSFIKVFCSTSRNGYGAGGFKTEASRSEEPYWEASGGALRITRIVPSTEDLI